LPREDDAMRRLTWRVIAAVLAVFWVGVVWWATR
jgi:hypothetical protein